MSTLNDLPLISTIAIGLSMAFISGFVATKLRISPLVGYILAGVALGPFTPGFVADLHIAEQLSEIGIVLLLFGVGLHFSVADFIEVRKIASIGAITRIAVITAVSAAIASLWGWSIGTGILFGLALSVASTVVQLRTLEEHHLMKTMTGKISIGWLIVEDVVMVLALVMIPAVAGANMGVGGNIYEQTSSIGIPILIAFGKVGLFAAVMVIVGKRVLPWLLTSVSRTGSRELFTLAAFSMAMGIAFGATILFGVSLALGAFFAGMMINESDLNHEVADRVLPFQDAFAVLFFVAVGMLFDPMVLIEKPVEIVVALLIIVLGKAIVTFGIVRFFGYPRKTALMTSLGLAQIGEFSFILLSLGKTVNMLPGEVADVILAGALISIAINPFLVKRAMAWLTRRNELPPLEDRLAHMPAAECNALGRNLILIIGFGRVGTHAASMLDPEKVELVIIDSNREKIGLLRQHGFHAIAGDATDKDILIEAQIEKAGAILITVPDPFDARRVVEQVRVLKPEARILVRSHNDEETRFFESQNVELAVVGTEEIARRMVGKLMTA
jgi:CPA2 family monovalent cation:H+ antiporter-2